MAGVNDALERTQYQPLLGVGQSETSLEQALVDAMIDRQMDGLLLVAPRIVIEDVSAIAARVPTVVIGEHQPGAAGFDTVNNDDERGGELAVAHLVEAGYRNIAYLSLQLPSPQESVVTIYRERGYRRAMEQFGLSRFVRVVLAHQSPREVQLTARHLLESRNRPEAIFCWTDFIALQVLSVAREMGLSVPGDIAIVGYDNTSYCDLTQNSLTSIDQSGQVLGLQAARLLIERIKGRDTAEHFVVTPRLVARGSSRPVSSDSRAS
jgi:LacI family transcriptional regulator